MRVGSGEGPDVTLLGELHARFPDVELLAGGGVRHAADLRALAGAGASGALVATALHGGAIGPASARAAESRPRSRCSTSAAATSTPVAPSTPRQPGMPLTSIT